MMWMAGQVAALFTAPALAAAGAAAISIPIAIHLLSRLKRTRVAWAAMRFLEEAWKRQRRRMQIEQLILLAVRCLLLVILGLALAGPQSALLGALGLSQSHRMIVIVLDDSLVSQVTQSDQETTRFEELKAAAAAIVQAASPGDELSLWTLAGEDRQRIAPGPIDRQATLDAIEALKASPARADLPSVLTAVSREVEALQFSRDRASVVVLSDFYQATLDPALPAPSELQSLAENAVLWLHRPGMEAGNVQITSLTSTRGLLIAQPTQPVSVPLTATLTRYGSELGATLSNVTIELTPASDTQAFAARRIELTRPVRWSAGQRQAVVNIDAPLGVIDAGVTALLARATVRSVTGDNRLAGDDARYLTLPVASTLRVAMVDETSAGMAQDGELRPGLWARLALSPLDEGPTAGPMQLVNLQPQTLGKSRSPGQDELASFDAILVHRPDLLTPIAWQRLAQATSQGRLLWVFAPADESGSPWPSRMAEAMSIGWTINAEPIARDVQPWELLTSQRAPQELAMLGPDWQALLGPVRVMKLLPVNLPAVDTQTQQWIQAEDGQMARPVLLAHPLGLGSVLLQAVALEPSWTDLMLKPLFVPLMHEAILGSLGEISLRQRDAIAHAGRRITLSQSTSQNMIAADHQLVRYWPATNELPLAEAADDALSFESGEQGQRVTNQPVNQAGVYRLAHDVTAVSALDAATSSTSPAAARPSRWLAVNVEAAGGDTTSLLAGAVQSWFALDETSAPASATNANAPQTWPWLDAANPGSFLTQPVTQADLGWPLLWTLLALVLLETWLARKLSYAHDARQQPSWLVRWWQRMVS